MKSKTSFWNKSIARYFLNNIIWLALIYVIGVLLIQLPGLINYSLELGRLSETGDISRIDTSSNLYELSAIQYFFTLIIVTIIAITQFDYKNHEASSDFMHALPVKRHHLLTHGLIIGLGILFIMTIFIGLIIYVVSFNLFFDITFIEIMKWILFSCFVIFVTYSFTIFVGMFVNRAPLQAVFTAAAMLLIYISWSLIHVVALTVFDGVPNQSYGYEAQELTITSITEYITFPLHVIDQISFGYSLEILFWLILAGILIGATYFLYLRHHVERVSSPFYYNWIHIMLSAWLSILGMLVFGLGILFVFGNLTLAIFSYIVGLALSYIIVEMILQFTPRIKLSLKTMIVTAIAALVFWIVFIGGWHMYLTDMPDEKDIDGVYIQMYDRNIGEYTALKDADILDAQFMFQSDEDNIQSVYEQHESLIESRRPILDYLQTSQDYTYNMHRFTYQLSDGSTWTREFNIREDEETLFTPMYDSLQPAQLDFLVNILKVNSVDYMYINTYTETIEFDEKEAQRFIEAYQQAEKENEDSALSYLYSYSTPMFLPSITFNIDQGNVDYLGLNTVHDIEHVNFYNPTVTELLLDTSDNRNTPISGMIGLTHTDNVYKVTLDDNLDDFLEDYNTLTIKEIMSEYDFEVLQDKALENVYEKVDTGEFDGNSNTLLIYEPLYSQSDYSVFDTDVYQDELIVNTPFIILGIEE